MNCESVTYELQGGAALKWNMEWSLFNGRHTTCDRVARLKGLRIRELQQK